MQSNETDPEVFVWPDIFRAIGPGDDMVVSAEKLREWLDGREHRKTLQAEQRVAEARYCELFLLADHIGLHKPRSKYVRNKYVSITYLEARLAILKAELEVADAELQSQLPKKEATE